MRVQSKRWFRRNRQKHPRLVKLLQHINTYYPNEAHNVEIDFCKRSTVAWYDGVVLAKVDVERRLTMYG